MVQNGLEIDLIEIKSGNDYKKHAALNRITAVENWKFRRKMVFCKGNISIEDNIEYFPWYMIMFYHVQKPESFLYEVDLSAV